jgi:hypothetical protein
VGTLGVGIINSTAFSLLANNNSKVNRNQISFGTIDFQLHPPTLTPIFANLDQEMDLTIGSLNFHVRSLGSIRLSDSIKSDLSASKTMTIAMSESSAGFSSEVISPVSFATMEEIEEKIEELDETMDNLDLGDQSEDFMICYDDTSDKSRIHGKQDWSLMRIIKLFSQAAATSSTTSIKYSQSWGTT